MVQWLWYPFIPFGKVTLIQGNPGKGKTWLAMAIAAYCTNGKELPNALPIEPFNVLYQTAEDGIADTIKPRLAKCGADMTRVRFINEDEKQLSMTDDRIEKAIRQNSVRLMIMDPIQAYLGANVDMNRAKPGMNPKTLQYLMGHSDISVTMNVYTHIGFDDAEEELKRIEEFRKARAEVEQKKEKPMSQKMFKVI